MIGYCHFAPTHNTQHNLLFYRWTVYIFFAAFFFSIRNLCRSLLYFLIIITTENVDNNTKGGKVYTTHWGSNNNDHESIAKNGFHCFVCVSAVFSLRCVQLFISMHSAWYMMNFSMALNLLTFKNTEPWNMNPNEIIHFYFFPFYLSASSSLLNTWQIEHFKQSTMKRIRVFYLAKSYFISL